jgi:site-specific DNA recombinase
VETVPYTSYTLIAGDASKFKMAKITYEEIELQNAVVKAINLALGNRDSLIKALQKNIETVLKLADETSVENIDAKLESLQKELLKRANSKKDYGDIADEIYHLCELKQNAMVENAELEGLKQRIAEMQEFLV